MAEGLLSALLARHGARADIGSAGLLAGGVPATDDAIAVMADRGVDISHHVSHTLEPELAQTTPLVIGMTRQHVREAVVAYGADMERTFTLKELVRRGEEAGPRRPDETVFDWLARVGANRRTADLMGDDDDDDVPDPVGRPRAAFEETAEELEILLRGLVVLLVGGPPRSAAYAESPVLLAPARRSSQGVAASEAGSTASGA
jgi:protein-tyrosine phosphatase